MKRFTPHSQFFRIYVGFIAVQVIIFTTLDSLIVLLQLIILLFQTIKKTSRYQLQQNEMVHVESASPGTQDNLEAAENPEN